MVIVVLAHIHRYGKDESIFWSVRPASEESWTECTETTHQQHKRPNQRAVCYSIPDCRKGYPGGRVLNESSRYKVAPGKIAASTTSISMRNVKIALRLMSTYTCVQHAHALLCSALLR
jgi:hypothetical protein